MCLASGKKKTTAAKKRLSPAEENLNKGIEMIKLHPLFSELLGYLYIHDKNKMGKENAALVASDNSIYLNKDCLLEPAQWANAIAHCQLHLAFGHFDADIMPGYDIEAASDLYYKPSPSFQPSVWNMACDMYIAKFLYDIKFGAFLHFIDDSKFFGRMGSEQEIYELLMEKEKTPTEFSYGTASLHQMDMIGLEKPIFYKNGRKNEATVRFAYALASSVSSAVSNAGQEIDHKPKTIVTEAAVWFQNHYPLLGALAASFQVIEDYKLCQQYNISIAAVDASIGEIYINPTTSFTIEEWKFVLAHEYLHAGLEHHKRCQGRDPYLWNIACDFVINDWLLEMQIGSMPRNGLLYDETLHGLSAESIYDQIQADFRKFSKMETFRGYGLGDVIREKDPAFHNHYANTTLDDFYKSALQQGLEYQLSEGRGLIPQGLIEEIRALAMPPIRWDIELAKWFDNHFSPLEQHRTYARPSRRQGTTPDIPRPKYIPANLEKSDRTFGVVVDTSGSMSTKDIGMALGSIASYAAAHDVSLVRVVFCDAAAYDAGYLSPEDIAGRVRVTGRGGTVLQPGINLLEQAKDFPNNGPILIITDGEIEDDLKVRHEHAFLLSMGGKLPFRPKGKVFYMKPSS